MAVQTYLQRATPPHLLGKVAAFVSAISTCAMPLGQALYGVLFEAFQARVWVVVLLGLGASLAVALAAAPRPEKAPRP